MVGTGGAFRRAGQGVSGGFPPPDGQLAAATAPGCLPLPGGGNRAWEAHAGAPDRRPSLECTEKRGLRSLCTAPSALKALCEAGIC